MVLVYCDKFRQLFHIYFVGLIHVNIKLIHMYYSKYLSTYRDFIYQLSMLSVRFLFYTAMPRQRGSSARMNFLSDMLFMKVMAQCLLKWHQILQTFSIWNMSVIFQNSFVSKRYFQLSGSLIICCENLKFWKVNNGLNILILILSDTYYR